MLAVRIVYFASLRESLLVEQEDVELADGSTVGDLLAHLRGRGTEWARLFDGQTPVRAAVDHSFAQADTPVSDGCEVGLFPPITGG